MRQVLLFIKHWYQPGMVPRARPVPLDKKPDRVWTLFEGDESKPPQLPIIPQHNHNAFLEDQTHDWNFWPTGRLGRSARAKAAPEHQTNDGLGTFDYFSRVSDRPVWLLLEYKE